MLEAYAASVSAPIAVIPEAQNSDYESGLAQIDGEAWHIRTAQHSDKGWRFRRILAAGR